MKIRLIEPAPAHLHMWSYTFLPRLGLPMDAIEARACGINHFTWFQTIRRRSTTLARM